MKQIAEQSFQSGGKIIKQCFCECNKSCDSTTKRIMIKQSNKLLTPPIYFKCANALAVKDMKLKL